MNLFALRWKNKRWFSNPVFIFFLSFLSFLSWKGERESWWWAKSFLHQEGKWVRKEKVWRERKRKRRKVSEKEESGRNSRGSKKGREHFLASEQNGMHKHRMSYNTFQSFSLFFFFLSLFLTVTVTIKQWSFFLGWKKQEIKKEKEGRE